MQLFLFVRGVVLFTQRHTQTQAHKHTHSEAIRCTVELIPVKYFMMFDEIHTFATLRCLAHPARRANPAPKPAQLLAEQFVTVLFTPKLNTRKQLWAPPPPSSPFNPCNNCLIRCSGSIQQTLTYVDQMHKPFGNAKQHLIINVITYRIYIVWIVNYFRPNVCCLLWLCTSSNIWHVVMHFSQLFKFTLWLIE